MASIALSSRQTSAFERLAVPMFLLSMCVHVAALFFLSARPIEMAPEASRIEWVDVPPPPVEEKKEEEVVEKKITPIVKSAAPKAPEKVVPPPSNDAPPKETNEPPPPIFTGVTMESTSEQGAFAAGVGNTAMGDPNGKAADPNAVKKYKGDPDWVPSGGADEDAKEVKGYTPPYPRAAKEAGVEGVVVVKLRIDKTGRVLEATLVRGQGYGLDEAALDALKNHVRFAPAKKDGRPVGYEFNYNFRFELN